MCRRGERQAARLSQTWPLRVVRSDTNPQVWIVMWAISKLPAKRKVFPVQKSRGKGIERSGRRCYARPSFRTTKERAGGVEKPIELTAEGVWNEISGRLREALNENTFSTWFAEVNAAEINDTEFVITVPNEFTREWIEGHFLDLISAAVRNDGGPSPRLRLQVAAAVPAPAARPPP